MNRASFIQHQQSGSAPLSFGEGLGVRCSEEECICKVQPLKIKSFHLIAIAIAAFLCATVLLQWTAKASSSETFIDKRNNVIACGYTNSIDQKERKENYNHHPFNNKNENSCPHQFNGSDILCCNDQKRKRNAMT